MVSSAGMVFHQYGGASGWHQFGAEGQHQVKESAGNVQYILDEETELAHW